MKLHRLAYPLVSAGLALGCAADSGTSARADATVSAAPDGASPPADVPSGQDASGDPTDVAAGDAVTPAGDDTPEAPEDTAALPPDSDAPGAFPANCGDAPLSGSLAGLSAQCVGSGATVVLVGGFPEGAAGMRPLAQAVAGLGHRAVTVDLPGWGGSPAAGDAAVATLSDALDNALDALGAPPAALVAHDVGALVAWDLGARHADAAATLVALSTPPGALALPDAYASLTEAGAEALAADDFASLRALVGDAEPAVLAELESRWSTPGALDAMLAFFRDNPSPAAATAHTPTLVVWGMADAVFPPITLTQLRGAADTQALRVLPGAGHTLHRHALAEVAGLVDDVVQGVPPRESLPLPAGLIGKAPPSSAPIPTLTAVVDEKGKPVSAAELASQTTVLWFYPLASSFG